MRKTLPDMPTPLAPTPAASSSQIAHDIPFDGIRLSSLPYICLLPLLSPIVTCGASLTYVSSRIQPPALSREFRGAWVATVANIDWPSKPGLTSAQQKAELLAILDQAVHLRLNAIIFQVRPSSDAFYASRLEPWSEYLTGEMGQPPRPAYDPLAFAVEEAHQRGLELHTWFNPYRVRTPGAKSPVSPNHISKVHPELVKSYGGYQWLDPGETAVQDHIVRVILDVVRRYDIDGAHIDDYFYPPPQKGALGKTLPFPDAPSWKAYQARGGKLNRDDWRRDNVDSLIQRLYQAIKTEKRAVKFGISPSGIWRPGYPPQIKGFDPYAEIYADSRKWFAQGWLDYLAPQLYWDIQSPGQSYPVLLKWWAGQNARHRHLWPGNSASRLAGGRPAAEILNQIRLTRRQPEAGGNILWSFKPLLQNRSGIATLLRTELYQKPALVPACPWLDQTAPAQPRLSIRTAQSGGLKLSWQSAPGSKPVWLWALQTKTGTAWHTEILPAQQTAKLLTKPAPKLISLLAVDHSENASPPCVLEQQMR